MNLQTHPEPTNFKKIILGAAKKSASASGTDSDSALYELEKTKLDLEKSNIANEHLTEDLHNKKQDRALRKQYANCIFGYLALYSLFCAAVLIKQGENPSTFALPENVLVALVGSTALSVIGLVGWVVKGLFRPIEARTQGKPLKPKKRKVAKPA